MRGNHNIFSFWGVMLIALLFTLTGGEASAQYLRERSLVREGNRQFDKLNYRSSLNRYNEALEHDSTSYEALYNRANSYQRLLHSESADSTLNAETAYAHYEAIVADTLLTKEQRAEVLRNLGESLFEGEKYEAALNAFRKSMTLNPDDAATKYNYVLTKRIVDQKRNAQQQQQNDQSNNPQQNNQDQNQDQNEDQQQNDQQNNQQDQQQQNDQQDQQDQQDEGKEQNQPENQDGDKPQDEEEQESQPKELNADQERMLDAIQAEEDKTQEKLKEGEKAIVVRGKKNW
ncbi:MAG: tetratricopeptide repeat protein [Alistipes sp.]|nr:tetratricopeptide repeat protein [Alistipes sp.]